MTTQVRFGVSKEGLLNSGDEEFLAAVEWRSGGLKQLAKETGDSDLSLRTIGLCWKQQSSDRALPKLSQPFELSTLDAVLQGDGLAAPLAVLRDVRKAVRRAAKKSAGEASKRVVSQLDRWLANEAVGSEHCPESLLAVIELLVFHSGAFPATTVGRLWKVALGAAIAQSDSFGDAGRGVDWQDLAAEEDDSSER